MSRKRKNKPAVPAEILAEGSEGTPVHVQADEAGTELHVSAEIAEVVEVVEEAPKSRKRRKVARVDSETVDGEHAGDAADGEHAGGEHAGDELMGVAGDLAAYGEHADGAFAVDGEHADDDHADDEHADDEHAHADDELAADGEHAGDELVSDGEVAVDGEEIAAVMPTSAASLDAKTLKHLVEALVFAADKPITVQRLRQLTRVADVGRLEAALAELAIDYQDRGVILQQVSGGFQFRTQTRFSAWVQQLIQGRPVRLSRAQLETLAIVAYRQPITRPEIDDIRGVDSSATLKLLLDRALIRILGKREEVGRPMLYGTTKEFLDFFSLGDLRELPTLREYSELTDESRKVMKDRLGGDPEGGSTPSSDDGGGAPPSDDGGAPPSEGEVPSSAMGDAETTTREAAAYASETAEQGDAEGAELTASSDHAEDSHERHDTDDADIAAGSDASEHAGADLAAGSDAGEHVHVGAGLDAVENAHVAADLAGSDAIEYAHVDGEDFDHVAGDADGHPWPHGSVRMAAVTPAIELEPKPEEPAVDAHVVAVLEGVAPDSGGPIQE